MKKQPPKLPAPAKKKEKAPPQTGDTEQQQQENKQFCAQNPDDPSCQKGAPPQTGPSEDQIQENKEFCAKNPNSPKCADGGKPPPDFTPPPDGGGQVPSLCEQNPQLPQCQQPPPEDTRPEEPPTDEGEREPPDFTPPDVPPPSPIPPSPPPADTGEDEPSGPTIQTVEECPAGQVPWGEQCVWPGNCPDGQVQYTDYSTDPPTSGTCGDTCPVGTLERAGSCIGTSPCYQDGGIAHDGQCLAACPEGLLQHYNSCVSECPSYAIQIGNVCESCPEGETPYGNECRVRCDAGEMRVDGSCEEATEVSLEEYLQECQANYEAEYGMPVPPEACEYLADQMCEEGFEVITGYPASNYQMCLDRTCSEGRENVNGKCLCVEEYASVSAQCSNQCNSTEYLWNGECKPDMSNACPDGQLHSESYGCVDQCPDGQLEIHGRGCVGSGYCGSVGAVKYNGECLDPDPENVCPGGQYYSGDGQCGDQCADGQPVLYGGNCYAECPPYADAAECTIVETTPPAPEEETQPPSDEGEPPAEDEEQPPAEDEQPPAEDEQPPAEDEQPPAEEQQPPDEDQTPPPDEQQPPTSDEQPSDDGQPPPETGGPEPSDDVAPPVKEIWVPRPLPIVPRSPVPPRMKADAPKVAIQRMPFAIVLSTSRYTLRGMPQNPHAKAGDDAFARYLLRDRGLSRSRIIRLSDLSGDDMEAFFGEAGDTRSQLSVALRNAQSSELIVYISGHAMPVDQGRDAVLLPRDGNPARPKRTGYALSTLYKNLALLGVKRLRLYFDAGFNSRLGTQPVIGAPPAKPVVNYPVIGTFGHESPPHWVVFTAASGDEPALADPQKPLSAFSEALIAGLRGAADEAGTGNADKAVSAGELFHYLRGEVTRQVKRATGGVQRPALIGSPTEILSVYTPRSSAVPTASPPPAPAQTAPAPAAPVPPLKPVEPSFDCSNARAPAEKAICANPEVAALDNQMAGLYYARRRGLRGASRRALTQQQRQWLGQRNACGSDVACLLGVYHQRIRELQ